MSSSAILTRSQVRQHPYTKVLNTIKQYPSTQFGKAKPFPHLMLDSMFDADFIDSLNQMYSELPDDYWDKSNDQGIEVKWRSKWQSEYDIPNQARELVRFFNSGLFLKALSNLTGIDNLISDPYYSGGGFNLLQNGGHLDVHVDGNWHDQMGVHRRLNLILYLNSNWQEEWGGALNFYDDLGEKALVSIFPKGNRLVIFETNDISYHGHPEPICCPEDESRTSIILYYYTACPRPKEQILVDAPHSALWRSKNWHDKRGNKQREQKK